MHMKPYTLQMQSQKPDLTDVNWVTVYCFSCMTTENTYELPGPRIRPASFNIYFLAFSLQCSGICVCTWTILCPVDLNDSPCHSVNPRAALLYVTCSEEQKEAKLELMTHITHYRALDSDSLCCNILSNCNRWYQLFLCLQSCLMFGVCFPPSGVAEFKNQIAPED